jgi:opacity protein-like surface antigen
LPWFQFKPFGGEALLRRIFSLILLTSALAVPAGIHAQATPPVRHASGVPNFELYGGYSYVFSEYGNPTTLNNTVTTHGMSGWDASLKVPIFGSFLGIKGDVSGNYNSANEPNFNPRSYYFLFGPQVSVHIGKSTLFAHGMVGSAHVSSDALPSLRSSNSLATAVGAGLDAGFSRHWAWRVTGDYYNTHYHQVSGTDANVDEVLNSNGRISTGPVFRF